MQSLGHRAIVETEQAAPDPAWREHMQPEDDLTDDQKKAFEQNKADFTEFKKQLRSFTETANSRLAASGLHRDPATHPNRCLICPCTGFQGTPGDLCTNTACRHDMTSHDGYY
jgi:hypothetical protein